MKSAVFLLLIYLLLIVSSEVFSRDNSEINNTPQQQQSQDELNKDNNDIASSTSSHVLLNDCGGYIKLSKEFIVDQQNQQQNNKLIKNNINYKKIQVNLIEKSSGKIIETTVCSPNGYYQFPIYDYNYYQIQLIAPTGWSFDINLIIKDQCKDQDYNFELLGFKAEGYVYVDRNCISFNKQEKNIAGIDIILTDSKETKTIATTLTDSSGYYYFNNIVPGLEYRVIASHDTWSFIKPFTTFTSRVYDNYYIPQEDGGLVVGGYDMEGRLIDLKQQPVTTATFHLFYCSDYKNADGIAVERIEGCEPSQQAMHYDLDDRDPLCSVQSDSLGAFKFRNVPCGKYLVISEFYGPGPLFTLYDIEPRDHEYVMDSGGYAMEPGFKVSGFSLKGKVINHFGRGVRGVRISINGERKTTTNAQGEYILIGLLEGHYNIEATKKNYYFEEFQDYFVDEESDKIKPIKVLSYDLCGQVSFATPPPGVVVNPREIILGSKKYSEKKTLTDNLGYFCFSVTPGTYSLLLPISLEEKRRGMKFTTNSMTVTVEDEPVLGLTFSQLLFTLTGKIITLRKIKQHSEIPNSLIIELEQIQNSNSTEPLVVKEPVFATLVYPENGDIQFEFRNVLPGLYKVRVRNDVWCWGEAEREINLLTAEHDINDIEFHQMGYKFNIYSPNSNFISIAHRYNDQMLDTRILNKGHLNTYCLDRPGIHEFSVKSCFRFSQETYQFDTNSGVVGELLLNIEKYLISSNIIFDSSLINTTNVGEISFMVQIFDYQGLLLDLVETSFESNNVYHYSYWADLGDELEFVPIVNPVLVSKNPNEYKALLFYPKSIRVEVKQSDKCAPSVQEFSVKKGFYLQGSIIPPVEAVKIIATLNQETEEELGLDYRTSTAITFSDSNGQYRVGPLYDTNNYDIHAEKYGYLFKSENDGKNINFKTIELGNIIITVLEQSSQTPIPGVVLSMSGHDNDYKQEAQVPKNGSIGFHSLFPGTYLLSAAFKDYNFSPNKTTFHLYEGQEAKVTLYATKIAYSINGFIRSINLQKIPSNINIGLYSDDNLIKETLTNINGFYSFNGLAPGDYHMEVKDKQIYNSTPKRSNITVVDQDIEEIDFVIIFSKQTKTIDITGTIKVDRNLNHQNLYAQLYSQDNKLLQSIPINFFRSFDFKEVQLKTNPHRIVIERKLSDSKFLPLTNDIQPQFHLIDKDSCFAHYDFEILSNTMELPAENPILIPFSKLISTLIVLIIIAILIYPLKYLNFFEYVKEFFKQLKKKKSGSIKSRIFKQKKIKIIKE
ncbi:hypothetical protein CYY_002290 [Polysphondylium violaceum]|uniref:Uncharacterized protein n=1 Tax=Polysphondylium violaceum TaxID=133409 RepID=A0A8J4PZK7_9MYCE|nr:hypothetical protein CYY_002290 [Polysphondylium violaceum]